MSPNKRLLQNLLFSALMLLCLVGVYLYAGYAQRQQASAPQQTQTAPPAGPPAAPEFSGDGRLLSGFLAAFAASGYAVGADRAPGEYLLYDSSLNAVCTLIPALQGQRVSGATLYSSCISRLYSGEPTSASMRSIALAGAFSGRISNSMPPAAAPSSVNR